MKIEVRNDKVYVDGYVNAVQRDSRPIPSRRGKFVEQIQPNAFQRALDSADNVRVLLNHDANRELSSTKDGFTLYEDSIGLRAYGTISDADVVEKARSNQLVGWSFGFIPTKEHSEPLNDGDVVERRYVDELQLLEVSIIDNTRKPCYIGTSISCRDDETVIKEYRESTDIHIETRVIEEKPVETPKETISYSKYETILNSLKTE